MVPNACPGILRGLSVRGQRKGCERGRSAPCLVRENGDDERKPRDADRTPPLQPPSLRAHSVSTRGLAAQSSPQSSARDPQPSPVGPERCVRRASYRTLEPVMTRLPANKRYPDRLSIKPWDSIASQAPEDSEACRRESELRRFHMHTARWMAGRTHPQRTLTGSDARSRGRVRGSGRDTHRPQRPRRRGATLGVRPEEARQEPGPAAARRDHAAALPAKAVALRYRYSSQLRSLRPASESEGSRVPLHY